MGRAYKVRVFETGQELIVTRQIVKLNKGQFEVIEIDGKPVEKPAVLEAPVIPDEVKALTKSKLDKWAEETHGIKLDGRKTKDDMLAELLEKLA